MAAITTPNALQNLTLQIQNKEYLDASGVQKDELIAEVKKLSIELSEYIQGHFKVSQSPPGDGNKTAQILSNLEQLSGVAVAPALDQIARSLRNQQQIDARGTLYSG